MGPLKPATKNDCAGKDQQQLTQNQNISLGGKWIFPRQVSSKYGCRGGAVKISAFVPPEFFKNQN
jgi:hypothetical protein